MKPLVLLALLIAASSTIAAQPPTASATNFPPTTFDGKVDVGGHKLRIVTYGQSAPTVVVEAGGSQVGVGNPDWRAVIESISRTTRICVYDRANLGSSDPAPTKSRTSEDIAKDLHAALLAAKVPGPYLLVGHSIGGFNTLVYASRYPNEVVGIVLVESSHPDQWSKSLAALPPESPNESKDINNLRKNFTSEFNDPSSNPEKMDVAASAVQVRAANALGGKPLVVLTRSPYFYSGGRKGLLPPLEKVWQDLQVDLCRLSSNSTHEIATNAGHFISANEPQLVIDAILKVMNATKNGGKL